jgi:uncharacterized protein (TIGR00297 family)
MGIFYRLVLGLILSTLIALAAYRRQALTQSGAMGAIVVGSSIFGFGGLVWGLVLIAFFVFSTLLSHYKEGLKEEIAADKFEKGGQRDFWQALANGGAGALIAAAAYLYFRNPVMFAAFVGAMATVNADTWATEIGVLSPLLPRLITTFEPVEPGTSGGVTGLGTLATALGALAIGLTGLILLAFDGLFRRVGLGALADPGPGRAAWLPAVALVGGLAGSLTDSLLGATAQGIYYCPFCEKETEKRVHTCGGETLYLRGWRWLSNDWVNFLSSLVGAAIAGLLWALAVR